MPRSAFSVILLILASGLWSLDAQTKERPAEGKPPDALRDLSTSLETLARTWCKAAGASGCNFRNRSTNRRAIRC